MVPPANGYVCSIKLEGIEGIEGIGPLVADPYIGTTTTGKINQLLIHFHFHFVGPFVLGLS